MSAAAPATGQSRLHGRHSVHHQYQQGPGRRSCRHAGLHSHLPRQWRHTAAVSHCRRLKLRPTDRPSTGCGQHRHLPERGLVHSAQRTNRSSAGVHRSNMHVRRPSAAYPRQPNACRVQPRQHTGGPWYCNPLRCHHMANMEYLLPHWQLADHAPQHSCDFRVIPKLRHHHLWANSLPVYLHNQQHAAVLPGSSGKLLLLTAASQGQRKV